MGTRGTKNVTYLKLNTLKKADDFDFSIENPELGKMSIIFTLGELKPVTCVLYAASDDLQKMKSWMEEIARDVRHTSVTLGSGAEIACDLTNVPESSVEKTYRYLDELFPSPLGVISVTIENGETYSAVCKVKHFINKLYVSLLMVSESSTEKITQQWYPHTEDYKNSEDFKAWMNKCPHCHQGLLSSSLIEWYLQSKESYTDAKPQFQFEKGVAFIVTMWADWGCIFWRDGRSIGGITELSISDLIFDFSDVVGLKEWYDDFDRLANDFREIDEETGNERTVAILREVQEWHIRGFRLAQEIRKRLPLNVVLLYEQSWDVAFGQTYFARDSGRIIFDSRKMENDG